MAQQQNASAQTCLVFGETGQHTEQKETEIEGSIPSRQYESSTDTNVAIGTINI